MGVHQISFRLPVSWDVAVRAIDHEIDADPDRFVSVDHTSGLYRLRQRDGVRLAVEYRIDTPTSTLVFVTGKGGAFDGLLGKGGRIDDAMRQLHGAIVDHVRQLHPAA